MIRIAAFIYISIQHMLFAYIYYTLHRSFFARHFPGSADFPLNRWQHSGLCCYLHRTKSAANRKFVSGLIGDRRFVRRLTRHDVRWIQRFIG